MPPSPELVQRLGFNFLTTLRFTTTCIIGPKTLYSLLFFSLLDFPDPFSYVLEKKFTPDIRVSPHQHHHILPSLVDSHPTQFIASSYPNPQIADSR